MAPSEHEVSEDEVLEELGGGRACRTVVTVTRLDNGVEVEVGNSGGFGEGGMTR